MKRILALVLVFLALTGTVYADTVDLSGMTFDELSELRTAINKEMLSRGFEKEVTVPVGTYIIGQDIPAGIYIISTDASMCIVETYDIYGKDDEYYILNRNEKIGKMVLVDGQTIEIRGGASSFAPYTGLGF